MFKCQTSLVSAIGSEQANRETHRAPHERRRSAGVPPASSPSVSLDEGPGGETPPKLAAVDGCATPCRFMVPMRGRTTVEAMNVEGPERGCPRPQRAQIFGTAAVADSRASGKCFGPYS